MNEMAVAVLECWWKYMISEGKQCLMNSECILYFHFDRYEQQKKNCIEIVTHIVGVYLCGKWEGTEESGYL